jgi:hypothetical protein
MSSLPPRFTPAHPHADIFALHDGQPLDELAARIRANGLREPIVLLDGRVLDGRRRERACLKAGVEPRYRQFGSEPSDGDDPLEFVIDLNLARRHLGEGERQLAAARYARARAGNRTGANQHGRAGEECSRIDEVPPGAGAPHTRAQAAERFEVTESAVDRAKKVLKDGTPALVQAVAEELVSLSDAQQVTKLPAWLQDRAVKDVHGGKAKTLAEAVEKRRVKRRASKERAGQATGADHVFNWTRFNSHVAGLFWEVEALARAYAAEGRPEYEALRSRLLEAKEAVRAWKKQLQTGKG